MEAAPLLTTSLVFVRDGESIVKSHPTGINQETLFTTPVAVFNPRWSPDASKVAFMRTDDFNIKGFVIVDSAGASVSEQGTWVCQQCSPFIAWAPSTPVLYVTDGQGIKAHDVDTGMVSGGVDEPIATLPSTVEGWSGFDLRGTGDFLLSGRANTQWDLWNQTGSTRITNSTWDEVRPRWSPDGNKIVYSSNQSGQNDIFVYSIPSNTVTQITGGPEDDVEPAWSPDGEFVVFASNRSGNYEIYVASGTTGEGSFLHQVTDTPEDERQPDWM